MKLVRCIFTFGAYLFIKKLKHKISANFGVKFSTNGFSTIRFSSCTVEIGFVAKIEVEKDRKNSSPRWFLM